MPMERSPCSDAATRSRWSRTSRSWRLSATTRPRARWMSCGCPARAAPGDARTARPRARRAVARIPLGSTAPTPPSASSSCCSRPSPRCCARSPTERPLILLLDDLHWADAATLLLLRHVVRATERAPLLILVTYRDTEVDEAHPLGLALAELRRARALDTLALTGPGRAGRRGADLVAGGARGAGDVRAVDR